MFLARGDHLIAAGQRDFEGLFDDDVLPCGSRGHGRLQMGPAGSADIDDVETGVLEEFVVVVVNRTPARQLGDFLAVLGLRRENGDDLRPANIIDRPRMKRRNHPAADNSETDFGHVWWWLTIKKDAVWSSNRRIVQISRSPDKGFPTIRQTLYN